MRASHSRDHRQPLQNVGHARGHSREQSLLPLRAAFNDLRQPVQDYQHHRAEHQHHHSQWQINQRQNNRAENGSHQRTDPHRDHFDDVYRLHHVFTHHRGQFLARQTVRIVGMPTMAHHLRGDACPQFTYVPSRRSLQYPEPCLPAHRHRRQRSA